jgi:hypothetical protein
MLVAALVGVVFVAAGTARVPRAGSRVDRLTTFTEAASPTTSTTPGASGTTAAPSTSAAASTTAVPTTTAPASDPGALPQTDEHPTASGATFTAGVDGLWEAIKQDRPELGLPFFFPKSAYLQVKSIDDPAGDFERRLVANFEDDVHALHAQLGPDGVNAKFVGITVPDDQAVFVQPGEEYNRLSYWRVYGTTMQYDVDGQQRSFPVTSLISWRGQWYVVHLGTIR